MLERDFGLYAGTEVGHGVGWALEADLGEAKRTRSSSDPSLWLRTLEEPEVFEDAWAQEERRGKEGAGKADSRVPAWSVATGA